MAETSTNGAAPPDGLFGSLPPFARALLARPPGAAAAAGVPASWAGVLARLSLPDHLLAAALRRSSQGGGSLQQELVAAGAVSEATLYRAIADELGLPFEETVDPARLSTGSGDALALLTARGRGRLVRVDEPDGSSHVVAAPERFGPDEMKGWMERYPGVARRLRIATPAALRAALVEKVRPALAAAAREGLFVRFPSMSARLVGNTWQGVLLGLALAGLPLALWLAPASTLLAVHIVVSVFFLACVALRLSAALEARPRDPPPVSAALAPGVPVYTVLVALRDEAEMVPDLLVALGRLVWPRARLEVRLVCEADDAATLAAIRAQPLRAWIEVIEVPPGIVRTKPNALAYALPLTAGQFVALYDAEDRPHPLQLVEAWRAFGEADPSLACVQAPLDVEAQGEGLLQRAFALEYAALFHGLLPFLARRRLVLPLGGTSNHFRRAALDAVGGWDPYNVTEDADLGLRLARFGYRSAMIGCPTLEDAPHSPAIWLRQRTRWFKGWVQTWLVHMRSPVRLLREVGPASFVLSQILFLGMVVSALAHPFLALSAFWLAARIGLAGGAGPFELALLAVDIANLGLGYAAFLLLGWRAMRPPRRGFWSLVAFVPVYWMMMSLAAWRAVWQLARAPHLCGLM